MYQRINGSDWRNIWLMGDLHGCFALLMNRLRQLRFDPSGRSADLGGRSDRSRAAERRLSWPVALSLVQGRSGGIMSRWRWRRWRAEICGSGR